MIETILTGLSIGGTVVGAAAGVASKVYQQRKQQEEFDTRMSEMEDLFNETFGLGGIDQDEE